ncbi:MAG: OadG family protein [Clostridiales bacterium]|nr:OadG family protein [Clostridiales bacterium]
MLINNIFSVLYSFLLAANPEELKKAWQIFGFGMLAIFFVILLIMSATYLMSYLAVKLKKQPPEPDEK